MKVVVSGEQISFYERFGYVELESFFTDAAVSQLNAIVLQTGLTHNLAIESNEAKKILLSPLGQAAYSFVRKSPIRYASDRVLSSPFTFNTALDTLFSVSPIVSALIIALDSEETAPQKTTPSIVSSLPSKAGNALFISPKTVLQCEVPKNKKYILLGFTSGKPMYILQPEDPYTHALKAYGYVFGDNLKVNTHPVMYSR